MPAEPSAILRVPAKSAAAPTDHVQFERAKEIVEPTFDSFRSWAERDDLMRASLSRIRSRHERRPSVWNNSIGKTAGRICRIPETSLDFQQARFQLRTNRVA